jgi:hypothetical protein
VTGATRRETCSPRPVHLLALVVGVALVATGCGGRQAIVRPEGGGELSARAEDEGSPLDPATVPAELDSSPVQTTEPNSSPVQTAEPLPSHTSTPNPTSTPSPTAQFTSPLAATLPTAPVEGALVPDLSLPDLNGSQVRLSDLRGKPVLLNFWTTW